jgi:hypothetical protein
MPSQVDKFKFPEPRNAWQFIQDAQDEAADVSGINCLNLWMPTWMTYFIMRWTGLDRRINSANDEYERPKCRQSESPEERYTKMRMRYYLNEITEKYESKLDVWA